MYKHLLWGERSIVIDSRFQVTNTQIIHFLKLTMTSLLISMTIAMVALQFQPQSQSWGKFQLFCFLVALICGDGERLTAKTYSNYEKCLCFQSQKCVLFQSSWVKQKLVGRMMKSGNTLWPSTHLCQLQSQEPLEYVTASHHQPDLCFSKLDEECWKSYDLSVWSKSRQEEDDR